MLPDIRQRIRQPVRRREPKKSLQHPSSGQETSALQTTLATRRNGSSMVTLLQMDASRAKCGLRTLSGRARRSA